jgi:cell division protein FtsZ
MTLHEINEASSLIKGETHEDANIIFGTAVDLTLTDEFRVTVIATGLENAKEKNAAMPKITVVGGTKRAFDLTVPTFIREHGQQPGGQLSRQHPGLDDDLEEDLEKPAFMRRQAD